MSVTAVLLVNDKFVKALGNHISGYGYADYEVYMETFTQPLELFKSE